MARAINVIAAVLACATVTSAVLAPFPHGKTSVYRYKTLVQTSTTENVTYASQFGLQATLNIEHDTRDPDLANAYNVALSNIVTDMYNGDTGEYNGTFVPMPSDSEARVILDPFLIIYHPNGSFQGVKIAESEPGWSMNLKLAMASTLQLDLASMNVDKMTDKPDTFVSQEKTIYGDCSVNYTINPQKRPDSSGPHVFRVTKTFTPMKCDGFPLREFNNVDNGQEKERNDEIMWTESSRLFEVEKQAEGILIRKLDARGALEVLSATSASYPHYLMTTTTFELLQVKEKSETNSRLGDFVDVPVIHDVTYKFPSISARGVAIDVTQGRRRVELGGLVFDVSEMLGEAVDYLEENHVTPDVIDMERARVINKMLHKMSFMDEGALLRVSYPEETELARRMKIQAIYLGLVSQVGTAASYRFALEVIANNDVPATLAMDMLFNLPLSVRSPTTELLVEVDALARLDASIPKEVRKAGILSFAALVYRTFKNVADPGHNPVLDKYIQEFADRVMTEPTVEMKVVCLMALRNIQVGKVADLLEPIVDGSIRITEDPERIRLLAIWAIDKPLEGDYATAKRVLWPVMENATLPTKLRVAAYEILMKQAPTKEDALAVHQYISSQDNRHFYHYHYTNLDSIVKTVDKKNEKLRVVINSIFETASYPPKDRAGRGEVRYPLSRVQSVHFVDRNYWHSEKLDLGTIVDELTGLPEVMRFEHTVTDRNGAISDLASQVHVEGHRAFAQIIHRMCNQRVITRTVVHDLLEEIRNKSARAPQTVQVDVILSRRGRVVLANHYGFEDLVNLTDDINLFLAMDRSSINYQHLSFDRLYEKHVASEIGVPLVMENRVPVLQSISMSYAGLNKFPVDWDLTMELKSWEHADDSMSIYNPIGDAWHSVRSVTDNEISLPISCRVSVNRDEDPVGLRVSFPELPATISPVAGYVDSGRHLVTVDDNGAEALMESCPTCKTLVTIRYETEPVDSSIPKWRELRTEVKDLGLKFLAGVHWGDYGPLVAESQLYLSPRWKSTFPSRVPHTWMETILQNLWSFRGNAKSQTFEDLRGSSGVIAKIEPSVDHPISHINFVPYANYEDYDRNETDREFLHARKWSIGAMFDVVSAVTNSTTRWWHFVVDVDTDRGHLARRFSLHITRAVLGEKKLKICIDGKKNYPVPPEDELMIGTTNEETDGKLTLAWGSTDGDECVRDQSVMTITVKSQPSIEQKRRWKHDLGNSDCAKDRKNPLLSAAKNMVPRTYNCMNEAIRYTTPRKYTFDVTYDKLTDDFASFVYRRFTQRREPRETGKFQFNAKFPMDTNSIEFEWMTNTSVIAMSSVHLNDIKRGYRGPTLNTLWDFPLDNSRFGMHHLFRYTKSYMRMCSIYPKMVMTGDGDYVPFDIPSDRWVLVSGDRIGITFAIFARQTKPGRLSFIFFMEDQDIRFYTRESDNVFVAKADGLEKEIEGGFRYPFIEGNYIWDLTINKQGNRFVVRLRTPELKILVDPNFMSITFDDHLQGHVSGLCGSFNGTGALEHHSIVFTAENEFVKN